MKVCLNEAYLRLVCNFSNIRLTYAVAINSCLLRLDRIYQCINARFENCEGVFSLKPDWVLILFMNRLC